MRRTSLLASALALALPVAKIAAPISAQMATPVYSERPPVVYAQGPPPVYAEGPPPVYAERGPRRGPPPEAIEACAAAEAQAACGFVSRRGDDIAGTCQEKREQLVCVPEGGPPGRGRRGGNGEG